MQFAKLRKHETEIDELENRIMHKFEQIRSFSSKFSSIIFKVSI